MTVLVPMRAEHFEAFLQGSAVAYANDSIRAGRWAEDGAHARALADLRDTLPQGVDTPGHHLLEILTAPHGAVVGYFWFSLEDHYGQRSAYVHDVEIKTEYRRQGFASAAFLAAQQQIAAFDIERIDLHVFAFNAGAIALYKKLGFQVTGVKMQKKLGGQVLS